MRTVKWNPFLAGLTVVLGSGVLWVAAAQADVSSTNAAAVVVFPKLVASEAEDVNTTIQLTNTSSQPVNVRCWYVNANGHCSDDPTTICDPNRAFDDTGIIGNPCNPAAGSFCEPGWLETDFRMRLTPNQPIAWTISEGLPVFPLPAPGGTQGGAFNTDSSVPPVSEDPFFGELKCVVVGDDELPIDRNWIKGEATIGHDDGVNFDIAGYNAVGIQAIAGANNRDNTLVLGQEYNPCPNIVAVDHFYDDAEDPISGNSISTELTFAPCSEDFNFQIPKSLVVQFLTYNEFEQRFSASRRVTCLTNIVLSDIDTRLGNDNDNDESSIFNVAVQGTLTGNTLMRGVNDESPSSPGGETFNVIVQRFNGFFSSAYVGSQRGTRPQFDTIVLPAAAPSDQ